MHTKILTSTEDLGIKTVFIFNSFSKPCKSLRHYVCSHTSNAVSQYTGFYDA